MTDDEKRTEWWLLMRSAFSIPEIVSSTNALAVIVGSLAAPFGGAHETAAPLTKVADCLVEAALQMGARGELDRMVVSSAIASYMDPSGLHETDEAHALIRKAQELPQYPKDPNAPAIPIEQLSQMTEGLLEHLRQEIDERQQSK
jgi:hypothetical protein